MQPDSGRLAGIVADLRDFFVRRPEIPTLLRHESAQERGEFRRRVLERLGVDATACRVLNVHSIHVPAPAAFVFDLLRLRESVRACWPRQLAALEVDGEQDGRVRVYLLGARRGPFGLRRVLGLRFVPLFQLDLLRVCDTPADTEDVRYLLYACSGGYPIGILGVLVLPSPAPGGRPTASEVFFVLSFDFYGRRSWPGVNLLNRAWEPVHNRATANMLNRFRALCVERFASGTGIVAPGGSSGRDPGQRVS